MQSPHRKNVKFIENGIFSFEKPYLEFYHIERKMYLCRALGQVSQKTFKGKL